MTKESELRKDIFSLGLLITELLSRFTDSDSQQFLEYAKSNLLLPDFNRNFYQYEMFWGKNLILVLK